MLVTGELTSSGNPVYIYPPKNAILKVCWTIPGDRFSELYMTWIYLGLQLKKSKSKYMHNSKGLLRNN